LNRVGRNTAQPSEIIDRSAAVEFKSDGRTIRAQQGDTIVSALYAAGITTFSRSFKYHRPRGLLCAAGHCPKHPAGCARHEGATPKRLALPPLGFSVDTRPVSLVDAGWVLLQGAP